MVDNIKLFSSSWVTKKLFYSIATFNNKHEVRMKRCGIVATSPIMSSLLFKDITCCFAMAETRFPSFLFLKVVYKIKRTLKNITKSFNSAEQRIAAHRAKESLGKAGLWL
jgi:predicted solute-binding protein